MTANANTTTTPKLSTKERVVKSKYELEGKNNEVVPRSELRRQFNIPFIFILFFNFFMQCAAQC